MRLLTFFTPTTELTGTAITGLTVAVKLGAIDILEGLVVTFVVKLVLLIVPAG